MKILVTGAAGFIGFHLSKSLLDQNHQVVGLDNLNNYYDINLKLARLQELGIAADSNMKPNIAHLNKKQNFAFYKTDLCNHENLENIFSKENFEIVVHLAAQAGVRYSITNPDSYIQSNLIGFYNVISQCKDKHINHFLYASSSSVYGNSDSTPFSIHEKTDSPISLYAATKKSNELIAHSFSHLFDLKTTGLRFFTVYGPWGRPDMAYFKFANSITEHKAISIFNNGILSRDFTYITDIVDGINTIISKGNISNTKTDNYALYNIGKGSPVKLFDFVKTIEKHLKIKATLELQPMQDGDVYQTWADIKDLKSNYNYTPKIDIDKGIKLFVTWYQEYYQKIITFSTNKF